MSLFQVIATLGTYDIAFELGKKVLCQRWFLARALSFGHAHDVSSNL